MQSASPFGNLRSPYEFPLSLDYRGSGGLPPPKPSQGSSLSLFYSIAAMLVLLYFFGATFGVPRWLWMPLVDLIQKCELAVALFAVVMLIGCLGKEQKLSYRRMKPIRAELSIIACILCLGHMAVYLGSYLPRLLGNAQHQQQCCRRLRRGRRTLRAARSSWRDVPRHREAGHEQPSLDAHPAIRLLILRSGYSAILRSCFFLLPYTEALPPKNRFSCIRRCSEPTEYCVWAKLLRSAMKRRRRTRAQRQPSP